MDDVDLLKNPNLKRVPSWLDSLPDRPVLTPPTVTRAQVLPFCELTWENFERLCLRLARLDANVDFCRRYGEQGDEQAGIDLYAQLAGSDRYVVYQCKRVKDFGPAKIEEAIDRFLQGAWAVQTARFVLCTQESLAGKQRTDAVEVQRARLYKQGIALVVWDSDELSTRLAGAPALVDSFFGEAWVRSFCSGWGPDLAPMRIDYLSFLRRSLEYLDLGGIAPKVANQTVKLRMKDLYVPVEAWQEFDVHQAWRQVRKLLAHDRDLLDFSPQRPAVRGLATGDLEVVASYLAQEDDQRAWQVFQQLLAHDQQAKKIASVQDILAQPRAVLLGHPGTGKTTTLKYVAYAVAAGLGEQIGDDVQGRLPIFVRLVKYAEALGNDPALSLRDYVRDRHDTDRAMLFRRGLESGECLVMLDGLDEVIDARQRAEIADQVESLVAEYPSNHYLVASRIVGYEAGRLTGDFVHFILGSLPESSIYGFVKKWYEAIEREGGAEAASEARARADELCRAIEERPGIRRLAENPLLLTIVALVNWKGRRLPHRRVELYRHAAETLVESWPHVRRGISFNIDEVLGLLEPVAYRIFRDRSSEEISEVDLLPLFSESVVNIKADVSRAEAQEYTASLLPRLSEHSGLFLERGIEAGTEQRLFGFLHLTFVEYLTARYLAGQWEKQGRDEERRAFLAHYLHIPRWREVVLLMVAHVGLDGRRTAATRMLSDLLLVDTPYDEYLHRNLLLAGDCLADDLQVEPPAAAWVLDHLTHMLLRTPIDPLRDRICGQGRAMSGTSYRSAIVDRCLERLRDGTSIERACAARVLGAMQSEQAVDGLLARLHDACEDFDVRDSAATALGKIGSERAVDGLLARLGDKRDSSRVRDTAALALGEIRSERALDGLLAQLQNPDSRVRAWAASALGAVKSDRVVDELLPRLQDSNSRVRAVAVRSLGQIKSERAVGELLARLHDSNARVRAWAVSALGAVRSERAVDGLLGCLHDEDEESRVRVRAAWALGEIKSERAVDGLLSRLQDENWRVSDSAAWALGKIECERAMNGLISRLQDQNASVRARAAMALGMHKSERVVDALLARLQDRNSRVRTRAVLALGMLKSERVVNELLGRLRDRNCDVRASAAGALGEIKSERAVDGLIARLQDENAYVRGSAAWALGVLESEWAVDALLERLYDEHPNVRADAAFALGKIKSERAVDDLLTRLHDELEDFHVHVESALALKELRSTRAISALLPWLADTQFADLSGTWERKCDWAYRTINEILSHNVREPQALEQVPAGSGVVGPWNME